MSNRICIEPTKFLNVRTDDVSFGVRIYDNYSNIYFNEWENIPDDDLEVLRKIIILAKDRNIDHNLKEIIRHIKDVQSGVVIGEKWYDWEEIKDQF